MTENLLDKLLDEAEDDGSLDEIREEVKNLQLDVDELKSKNKTLEEKNQRLMNGTSPSILERYKNSNKNYKNKIAEANDQIKKLKRRKGIGLEHLDAKEVGVYSRMIDDFNGMERSIEMTFPGVDHPIFTRFFELANKYPNRTFIVNELSKSIKDEKNLIDFEIKTQQKNITIWEKCNTLALENPDTWQDEVSDLESYLYQVTTPEKLESKIKKLEKDKKEVDKWFALKNNIKGSPIKNDVKVKNNLYYAIIDEFKRVFNFCKNVGGVTQYKASIKVDGFNKDDMYSALTRELERQVGLCEEPYTHNFFYSNGEGRLVPYELNRDFLRYINENTTFVKYGKKNKYKSGNIINSKVLFNDIPLFCNKVQYRNPNLVGFNNCFYNVETGKIISLNPQAPILPLKNTKTELYLDAEIEDNPMKDIFETCFTEKDKRILLAYIGCALYDKGYTQRQESLYLMGKGGTGKTTLTRAICSIFYSVGHQLVTKLSDNNEFGFSMFADSDIVVIDEIQAAKKEFANKMKNISGGEALPVEKKHYDTISVPAENVPRVFLIGNNFSKKFYEESDAPGVKRRILIIIPTQPIQNCGYQWADLITDSCKQWLVHEATKEYMAQGLHKKSVPIGMLEDGKSIIDDEEKANRMTMCTYPEQYFIKKHFSVARLDTGAIDNMETLDYEAFHTFISKCIDDEMLEPTVKFGVAQSFIPHVKEALSLPQGYHTSMKSNHVVFGGIVPKSNEAIEFISGYKKVIK